MINFLIYLFINYNHKIKMEKAYHPIVQFYQFGQAYGGSYSASIQLPHMSYYTNLIY